MQHFESFNLLANGWNLIFVLNSVFCFSIVYAISSFCYCCCCFYFFPFRFPFTVYTKLVFSVFTSKNMSWKNESRFCYSKSLCFIHFLTVVCCFKCHYVDKVWLNSASKTFFSAILMKIPSHNCCFPHLFIEMKLCDKVSYERVSAKQEIKLWIFNSIKTIANYNKIE